MISRTRQSFLEHARRKGSAKPSIFGRGRFDNINDTSRSYGKALASLHGSEELFRSMLSRGATANNRYSARLGAAGHGLSLGLNEQFLNRDASRFPDRGGANFESG